MFESVPASIDFSLHPYWYLGRAGGFVAFVVLLLSLSMGVMISSRLFDGLLSRGWFFELHKFVSLFLVVAVLFHAFVMLPDPYANFTVPELLIPFRSHIDSPALALGIISLYGLVLINVSFYVTRWIGQKNWRRLHYLTFATYWLGIVHAIWAGTDSDLLEVRYFYLASGVALVFLILYRIMAARSQKAPNKATPRLTKAGEPTALS